MTTLTGKFIKDILKKSSKTIVDDEILSESERIMNEEMSAKRRELTKDIKGSKETNLSGQTTVISGTIEVFLLEALKNLGKSEIDKDFLVMEYILY
ncbi:hypothetical protein LGK95_17455 [Clostridium algoriphilum]|uniref:hypothetical protein n=1 Tax=Clostridium algoriphilum TaxID=198347 RepID=UPI001CF1117F|nr:hypothetical protein [Clostridium algoriphilum]MCB2295273.1 hypothetical protein [Clostridium algoriphilum]